MAVTVKKAVLWSRELENRPGALAEALKPLSDARVNLQVVMGYSIPGQNEHAAVEVWPVSGRKAEEAAGQAQMAANPRVACLVVTGDDAPGLGHKIAAGFYASGINLSFVMVQVSGKQYHGVYGFESEQDADKAVSIIKEAVKAATAGKRKSAGTRGKASGARKTAAGKTGAKKKGTARGGAKKSAAKKPAPRKSATKSGARKKSR